MANISTVTIKIDESQVDEIIRRATTANDSYRHLLKNYMRRVIDSEGIPYIDEAHNPTVQLTPPERSKLLEIYEEITNEG